jgi:hypothetical protein
MRLILRDRGPEPTWQDKMDRDIEDAQGRLQRRLYEYDRTLEALTAQGPGTPTRSTAVGNP